MTFVIKGVNINQELNEGLSSPYVTGFIQQGVPKLFLLTVIRPFRKICFTFYLLQLYYVDLKFHHVLKRNVWAEGVTPVMLENPF